MKVSINLDTGLMIESQSKANNETLIKNAASLGFTNIEVREVDKAEHEALIAARDLASAV